VYRKLSGDKIFDGYRFLEGKALILTVEGIVKDIIPVGEAGNDIEVYKGILIPGFINCHCHLELSHMKGLIPENTGLVDFVFKVVSQRHYSEEEIKTAVSQGEEEMIKNGIVAVGDICNNPLTLEQKKKGRIQYYNFIEASGWLPQISETRFKRAFQLFEEFCQLSAVNCRTSIVPHAPYSVSEDLWRQLQPYFENRVVSIHNQETAFEDQFFVEGKGDFIRMYELMKIDNIHHRPTGKSSLQSYFNKLTNASEIILVHNTFTREKDIEFVKREISDGRLEKQEEKNHVYFCLCVNANLYIENALPPVELLRSNNCTIVLGTDSLASNWSLNIMEEINTIQKHFPSIHLEEILQWATINGARALKMEDVLGSFEKGKRPGVVLINNEQENNSIKRII